MRKELLLALTLCAGSIGNAYGVATNYDLTLAPDASVECDRLIELDGARSYTIQLWFNPASWTEGAQLLSAKDGWSLSLGKEGTVVAKVGDRTTEITSGEMALGKWTQLTLITDGDKTEALVNGNAVTVSALGAMPEQSGQFTIGGGYNGRIDEVRVWKTALDNEFNYFIKNTLNRWCPDRESLVVYYKFDQKDCPNIVEQTAVWDNNTTEANNHGVITGNATVSVSDNAAMKYRINGAYTANERFFDRAIPKDQYLLSNDLIILGIESSSDGHLEYGSPCYHGTVEGGAKYLAEADGRKGVISFDGNSGLNLGKKLWNFTAPQYTFESWVYIDEWTEGASIFCKETADGNNGISLKLGPEAKHVLTLTIDGHPYSIVNKVNVGKWFYIVTYPLSTARDPLDTFVFYVDGKECFASPTYSDKEAIANLPTGNQECDMVLGKNLKGKLDNTAFWHYAGVTGTNGHMKDGCPMPGIGIVQTTDYMRQGDAYYEYNRPDNVGFDSYSQDSWRDIMLAAYEGMEGYEVRISVKSHSGWENTIANAARRKIFAADLARLSEGYDGVELDLEWMYGTQTNLGLLAEEIRKALPEGKSFMISCHNVAYQFPKDKMQYVDGFTFQQYGPQNIHSYFSHFTQMCNTFVNYGFDREKIVTSYATTTSKGYKDGTAQLDIKGVRSGFFDDDFVPDEEIDSKEINGYTYYFDGPLQTYKRARHTVDNEFGGIFYWDMGNDVPVEHKYNMAKWCSYGLNSNVEPRVTEVNIIRTTGIEDIVCDKAETVSMKIKGGYLYAPGASNIVVYSLSGFAIVNTYGEKADISALTSGVYVAKAVSAQGEVTTLKFNK